MGRRRFIALIAGLAALAALSVPASALAGTYSWNMPGDFHTSPLSNPDTDQYGGTPWSYLNLGSLFTTSSASFDGGLAGWVDTAPAPHAFVAKNPTSSTHEGVQPGQVAMLPASGGSVTIAWTSPFSQSTTVTVGGNVTQPNNPLGLCTSGFNWSLNNGASPVASGHNSGTIGTTSVTVPAGGALTLSVQDSSLLGLYSRACDIAVVGLQIQAPSIPPTVTLSSPAAGAVTGSVPTFAGSASTDFGDAKAVTVRVYSGSSASGSPIQTLTTDVSGGSYSVPASSPLSAGTYTAQAEQDDLAGDQSFSSPVTFTVSTSVASVGLASPGSAPLLTPTPTFTGAASGMSTVNVFVYAGSTQVASGSGPVTAGNFSITVAPALPDGQYTAIAKSPVDSSITSSTQAFRIKVHPPAVTLDQPAAGVRISGSGLALSGHAGTALGDSDQLAVVLYSGGSASGTPVGTLHATATGDTWSARWPSQLAPGQYTAQAEQKDDAGHTGFSPAHTFFVFGGSGRTAIGPSVRLTRAGFLTISINCMAPTGETCTTSVLVVTLRRFQPVAGGPSGRLRLVFAYVTVPGGRTVVIRRHLPAAALRALRHRRNVKLRVTTTLGSVTTSSAIRLLRTR